MKNLNQQDAKSIFDGCLLGGILFVLLLLVSNAAHCQDSVALLKAADDEIDAGLLQLKSRIENTRVSADKMLATLKEQTASIRPVSQLQPFGTEVKVQEIEQVQITFQVADAAELEPYEGRVSILAENLDPGKTSGVKLIPPEGTGYTWAEVHNQAAPFPPKTLEPYKGAFNVVGKIGDKFWVSLRGDGPPPWVEVIINPSGDDDDDDDDGDPDDYSELTEFAREAAAKLNDQGTANNIKAAIVSACDAIDKQCETGSCPTLAEAKRRVVQAIDFAKKNGRVDWYNGWRVPVSDQINSLEIKSTPQYVAAMRAVAKGL